MRLQNEKIMVYVDGQYKSASLVFAQHQSLFCFRSKTKVTYLKFRDYPFYVTIYKNTSGDFFKFIVGEETEGDCVFVFFKTKDEARKYADSIEKENSDVYAGITEIHEFSAAAKKIFEKTN